MTQVWDRLYIGGIDDACGIAKSNPFAITTVITLCREPIRIHRGGVNYLSFPVGEAQPISAGKFDAIFDALFENIRWGKVLVANGNGATTASIIAAAWMHAVGCKDIDTALDDIGKLHPIDPSPILLRSTKRALL